MVKVSVIIPVYNVEKYLKKCLDSVINQTLSDIEIICVDDGSTDNSYDILTEYKDLDNRIQVYQQENQGHSGATNTGLKHITGDYIFFVDSDDWIELDALEKLYDEAIKSDADLVLYNSVEHLPQNQDRIRAYSIIRDLEHKIFDYRAEKRLVMNSAFVQWSKLYKTSFFKQNNFKLPDFQLFEDIGLNVAAILSAEKITYLPEVLYHYNKLNASSLQNTKLEMNRSKIIFDVVDYVENYLKENNYFKELELNFLEFKIKQTKLLFENINEESKGEFYQDLRKCFLAIESDPKLISKLPFDLYSFFIHVITFETFEEYNVVNHYKNNINELFFDYLDKKELDLKLNNFTECGIDEDSDIIISLTSFPERINEVQYSIYSILDQSLKPRKVILWLAEDEFPNNENDLPEALLNLKDNGLEIRWCDNLKSYKKLIPTIKEYSKDVIITFDDDTFYPNNLVESLYNEHLESPDSIICTRSRKIKLNEDKTFDKYVNWQLSQNHEDASYLNLFTGVGGVLYPPNSLNDNVIDYDLANELCPNADDIWFWTMAVLNKTKVIKIDWQKLTIFNICRNLGFSNEKRLFDLNIDNNDIYMKNILNEFPQIIEIIGDENE